jgi:high-affinity K+ transport system ATPase subunit B
MERLSITSLVAADENKRAVGIIHIHDILKQGIA